MIKQNNLKTFIIMIIILSIILFGVILFLLYKIYNKQQLCNDTNKVTENYVENYDEEEKKVEKEVENKVEKEVKKEEKIDKLTDLLGHDPFNNQYSQAKFLEIPEHRHYGVKKYKSYQFDHKEKLQKKLDKCTTKLDKCKNKSKNKFKK